MHVKIPGTIKEKDGNFTDFAAYFKTFSNTHIHWIIHLTIR